MRFCVGSFLAVSLISVVKRPCGGENMGVAATGFPTWGRRKPASPPRIRRPCPSMIDERTASNERAPWDDERRGRAPHQNVVVDVRRRSHVTLPSLADRNRPTAAARQLVGRNDRTARAKIRFLRLRSSSSSSFICLTNIK